MDFISSRVAAINASGPTAGLSFCGRPCLRLLRWARGRVGIDVSAGSFPADSNKCIARLWQSPFRDTQRLAGVPWLGILHPWRDMRGARGGRPTLLRLPRSRFEGRQARSLEIFFLL